MCRAEFLQKKKLTGEAQFMELAVLFSVGGEEDEVEEVGAVLRAYIKWEIIATKDL